MIPKVRYSAARGDYFTLLDSAAVIALTCSACGATGAADRPGLRIPIGPHVERDHALSNRDRFDPRDPVLGREPHIPPRPLGADKGQRMPLRAVDPTPGRHDPERIVQFAGGVVLGLRVADHLHARVERHDGPRVAVFDGRGVESGDVVVEADVHSRRRTTSRPPCRRSDRTIPGSPRAHFAANAAIDRLVSRALGQAEGLLGPVVAVGRLARQVQHQPDALGSNRP